MRKIRILAGIMRQTGADRILSAFGLFFIASAVIIWIWEPQIRTLGDALWFCYAVITTTGFGDVLVTTPLARAISVMLSVYAALVIAITTGVVVNYFNQIVKLRQSETLASVLDRMEHLPEMTREELKDLSEKIKRLRKER